MCSQRYCFFCSVLGQVYLYDASEIVTVEFNPKKMNFVAQILTMLPSLDQLPVIITDHSGCVEIV